MEQSARRAAGCPNHSASPRTTDYRPAHRTGGRAYGAARSRTSGDLSRFSLTWLGTGIVRHLGALRYVLFRSGVTDLLIMGVGIQDGLRRSTGR